MQRKCPTQREGHSTQLRIIDMLTVLYNKPTARVKMNGDQASHAYWKEGQDEGGVHRRSSSLFIEPMSQLIRQSSDDIWGARTGPASR